MISILTRYKPIENCTVAIMLLAGKAVQLPENILLRARQIHRERQAEYAIGFLGWFILYKLGLKLPKYNIYHLISVEDKEFIAEILTRRLNEFRVAKQYYLLQEVDEINDEFRANVKSFLESRIQSPRKNTAVKIRRFDTSKAFNALCTIDSTLKDHDLHPFLVSGTLLGAIRDNALIEGDNDLDIGILSDEASGDDIFQLLVGNPAFRSVYNLGHLVQVTDQNGIVTDVFIHYRQSEKIWHGTDIHKWVNTQFELAEHSFQGHTFFIPDDPNRYLDENYGNWQTPVLFWDYSFDTPNREFFSNRKTAYYLAERVLDELSKEKPSRHTVQTALEALQSRFGIDLTNHLGSQSIKAGKAPGKEKVVITFGTFDLFHIGHLNILKRAAELGDRLIVGVSSDALNYSKKQISPVYCQEDRLKIVESITGVDDAFYEESLELKREYIEHYQADALVMGADWEGKFDYLSDICDVIYLTRTENISTSETKDSIKKNL